MVLAVFVTACSAEAGAGESTPGIADETAAPADPSTATAPASLQVTKQPAAKFSGASTKNTKSFSVGAPLRVDYNFSGSGNFIASLQSSDGTLFAPIANVIGKRKATTWVYGGSGKAHFEIIASGKWTISATTVAPKIAKLPASFKGSVGMTTAPFVSQGDLTIKWSHKGKGNFIVTLIDPTDGSLVDGVANVIGNQSDETIAYGQDGLRAFDVLADGAWTISVSSS
jgi:hypothetical protein